jgi:hypothetical protein
MLTIRRAVVVASIVLATLLVPSGASAFTGLVPGGVTPFPERVIVNVVFVGFEPGDVPWEAVRAELPAGGRPIVRSRAFYGIQEPLGLDYAYDYRPHYTDQAWEDDFFAYLSRSAVDKPLTEFQTAYNEQAGALDVAGNSWIDAPSVEKRLIDTAPPSVDTRRPTVFFINWYGRPDFRFHVYAKTGEPDPDTGHDFGEQDDRKLVAWGGTTPDDEESGLGARGARRVWFHDLSAGPESWSGSFDVTNADLDQDGRPDYRIPPVWEYGHYREKAALPHDLGKVVRYVGLDLLFTSSPLYPPYFTPDRIPRRVDLDTNTVEGWPGVDASSRYVTPNLFLGETVELPTGLAYSSDAQDLPFTNSRRRCYVRWLDALSCYRKLPNYPPDANLFLEAAKNRSSFLDGDAPYEAALLNYAVADSPGLLGYADDNWIDGTQSGVFSFVYPDAVDSGYGLTTTMIHEYGHHSGMSHPHDGYDPASGVDFDPTGERFFAWLGDESNSMMSYIDLNWDFSQFDRDNSARHHAAGYALIANRVAAAVIADPDAGSASADLAAADARLVAAQGALAGGDYAGMLGHAAAAYGHVRAGAARAGVQVEVREPSTWTVVPPEDDQSRSRMKPSVIDLAPRTMRKRAPSVMQP